MKQARKSNHTDYDLNIIVEGIKFHAHWKILRDNTVFFKEFYSRKNSGENCPGERMNVVHLKGIKPELFENFLRYVYSNASSRRQLGLNEVKGVLKFSLMFGVRQLTNLMKKTCLEDLAVELEGMDCSSMSDLHQALLRFLHDRTSKHKTKDIADFVAHEAYRDGSLECLLRTLRIVSCSSGRKLDMRLKLLDVLIALFSAGLGVSARTDMTVGNGVTCVWGTREVCLGPRVTHGDPRVTQGHSRDQGCPTINVTKRQEKRKCDMANPDSRRVLEIRDVCISDTALPRNNMTDEGELVTTRDRRMNTRKGTVKIDQNREKRIRTQHISNVALKERLGLAKKERLGLARNEKLGLVKEERLGLAKNETLGLSKKERLGLARNERLGLAKKERLGLARNERLGLAMNERLGLAKKERLGLARNESQKLDSKIRQEPTIHTNSCDRKKSRLKEKSVSCSNDTMARQRETAATNVTELRERSVIDQETRVIRRKVRKLWTREKVIPTILCREDEVRNLIGKDAEKSNVIQPEGENRSSTPCPDEPLVPRHTPNDNASCSDETLVPRASPNDQRETLFLTGGIQQNNYFASRVVLEYDSINGAYVTRIAMTTSRYNHGIAQVAEELYLVGGNSGFFEQLRSSESFSVERAEWSRKKSMREARDEFSLVVCDGCLYAIGGHNGIHDLRSVERLEVGGENACWEFVTSMESYRAGTCAVSVDNRYVYVAGGFNGQVYLKSVELYDTTRDTWTTVEPMKIKRAYSSLVLFEHNLYILGGFDGKETSSSCEVYDTQTKGWKALVDMNTPRMNSTAVVFMNSLFVFGGECESVFLETVERYDVMHETWGFVQRLPQPMAGLRACVYREEKPAENEKTPQKGNRTEIEKTLKKEKISKKENSK